MEREKFFRAQQQNTSEGEIDMRDPPGLAESVAHITRRAKDLSF